MMTKIFQRFPSTPEIIRVFWAAVLPIHLWAVFALLQEIPGYLLRFRLSDILIITAYTLSFALIESILVTGIFVLIGWILPYKLFRDFFSVKSSVLIWITSIWVIPIHVLPFIYDKWTFQLIVLQILIFLWVMTYVSIILLSLRPTNNPHFRSKIQAIIDNLTLLSVIYFVIDIVSVIAIISRFVLISLET